MTSLTKPGTTYSLTQTGLTLIDLLRDHEVNKNRNQSLIINYALLKHLLYYIILYKPLPCREIHNVYLGCKTLQEFSKIALQLSTGLLVLIVFTIILSMVCMHITDMGLYNIHVYRSLVTHQNWLEECKHCVYSYVIFMLSLPLTTLFCQFSLYIKYFYPFFKVFVIFMLLL